MSALDVAEELGRLAELAAAAVDRDDVVAIETRLAAALVRLREHRSPGYGPPNAMIDAVLVTAADRTRPLHRRIAAWAHLHRVLPQLVH